MNRRIILASASPRRRMLMEQIGIPCEVLPADADETVEAGTSPAEAVAIISQRKAHCVLALAACAPPTVIIAADTVVCVDGRILGKPCDTREAYAMLTLLQGRRHTVYTGVTLLLSDGEVTEQTFVETAEVHMRALSDADINAYIATGEPLDKAGAYGAQEKGALLVERIEGDYYTVVGLPLARLCTALRAWDINLMAAL